MSASIKDSLSILIVTWNSDDLLMNCLNSITSVYGFGIETVIVDNANSQTTKSICEKYPDTIYVSSPENRGFAGGNNLGVVHCTRKYILLLNDDTLIRADSFTPLVEYLDEHHEVGVVQGTLTLPLCENRLDTCGTDITGIGNLKLRHFMQQLKEANLTPTAVFSAKGAMLMFRASLLEELRNSDTGLFHDSFFNNYEESDFCHRVWLVGKEVHFVPTPPVEHICNATIARLNASDVKTREISNIIFSYFTLLDLYGLFRLIPPFFCYRIFMTIGYLIRFNGKMGMTFPRAIVMAFRRRREISSTRKFMQSRRVVDDKSLFKKVMIKQPLSYWWGVLKTYLKGSY